MSKKQVLIASLLFLAVTGVKFLLPAVSVPLRAELTRVMAREPDFRQTAAALGSRITGGAALEASRIGGAAPSPTPEETAKPAETVSAARQTPKAVCRPKTIMQVMTVLHSGTGRAPDAGLVSAYAERAAAEQEAAQTQENETVAAFLAAQSAYSGYALPENVSYAMPKLGLPYASPVTGVRSSGFGYRVHPVSGEVRFHYGTDFAAWQGTEVHCFADGTVAFAGEDDSYGKYVTVTHESGCTSLYAHCSELLVSAGETVVGGQVIARVGDTGLTTGPHLHFELKKDGTYLNPEYYVGTAA